MSRIRLWGIALIVAMLFAGACSSSGGDETSTANGDGSADPEATTTVAEDEVVATTTSGAETAEVPEGSVIGITDGTINITIVRSDTKALEEAGVLPDAGDPVQNAEVFAQLANDNGGAGGREIIVSSQQYPPGASATDQQASCLAATEDDEAAIVIFIGGMAPETVLCVTEQHERLAYAWSGILLQDVYDRSAGRLFSHAMSTERLMAGWATSLADNGALEGATIGLVRQDQADHEAAADALEAALTEAGFEITEHVALPCEGRSCSQNDIGVQKLQSAGVDVVFSLLGAIQNPTFIGEADAVGYEPQWMASDFENQVFDVSVSFMGDASGNYDGAVGFSYSPDESSADAYGTECYERFNAVTGIDYEFGTDSWSSVRTACYVTDRIVEAAGLSQDLYGTVNQATLIEQLETLDYQLGDITGSWGPTKHDAADTFVLKSFAADCVCWTEIEGSRGVFTG